MLLCTVLVIGLTSAALLICSVSLTVVAVNVIWCLRKNVHKESTLPVDMVKHVLTDKHGCAKTTGEMIIQQNLAYEEQVQFNYKKEPTPPVDMVEYDVPVFTNRQDCVVTTRGMIIQHNVAYEQVQWN